MSVKLYSVGGNHAASLISSGKIKDSKSWNAPSASAENNYIEKHGLAEYGKWFLGEDTSAGEETKGRFKFPFTSDFESVDYAGLRACITRAAGAGYTDIQTKAKSLYELAGAKLSKDTAKDILILDCAGKLKIEVRGAFEGDDDDGPVDVLLHEPVGRPADAMPWEQGITSGDFSRLLDAIPPHKKIFVGINSNGGSVTDGMAIANKIRSMGDRVSTRVDGMAASMGSIIHQAGATRLMMPGTTLGLHNPSMGIEGDYRQADWACQFLKDRRDDLVDLYHDRSGISKGELKEMMDRVTVLNAKDALAMGLCDEIVAGTPCMNVMPSDQFTSWLKGASNRWPAPAANPPTPQPTTDKKMKQLMTALAEVKLVASAELPDDAAAAAFRSAYGSLVAERDALKTENQKFRDDRKTRVTALIELAFTDKLITELRKTSMIALGAGSNEGESEVMAQIADLRALQATRLPRGVPPARPGSSAQGDLEAEISGYQEEMSKADCSAEVRAELAVKSLKARGLDGLFKKQSLVPDSRN